MKDVFRKELIKIAHFYEVSCRFDKRVKVPYSSPKESRIVLRNNPKEVTKRIALSDFFHELGHIIDYRNGFYRAYYKDFPTVKELKKYALKAELHTDFTGNKLMKKHFPQYKFAYTYKYKKWQKFLKEYWRI